MTPDPNINWRLRLIPNPTPAQVLEARCGYLTDTQIGCGYYWEHMGEDGWIITEHIHRSFFIREQNESSGSFQDWAFSEILDSYEAEADDWHVDYLEYDPSQDPNLEPNEATA